MSRSSGRLRTKKSRSSARTASREFDFERIASELVRSVRGDASRARLSRRGGYRSNSVSRWEAGTAFPTASRFLSLLKTLAPGRPAYVERFFTRPPAVFDALDPTSPAGVAAFLRELRGRTPILAIARDSGFNRYSVSRWLKGQAEPRLPEFLCLVETLSRRLLDFIACVGEPRRVASVVRAWDRLELARSLAYDMPWSHAVLRALELDSGERQHQKAWLAERLGIGVAEVSVALRALVASGQVKRSGGRYGIERILNVDTSRDRTRAHALKIAWTRTALERMQAGAPGAYGYTLFAVSRADLRRLRELHLEYVRAMQYLISESSPGECVGLYCAELMDLAATDNVFGA